MIARGDPPGSRQHNQSSPVSSALPINPGAEHRLMARGFVAIAGPDLLPQRYPLGVAALTKSFAFRVVHLPSDPKTHPSWRPFEWSAAKAVVWPGPLRCD